jgi:hypothetical protein
VSHAYGTLDYQRAHAITLVEDIAGLGHLMTGGEQYPNALCAVDAGDQLKRAVDRSPDIGDEERDACLALSAALVEVWNKGLEEEPGDGGVPIPRLSELADTAMTTGVPAWAP